MEGICRCENVAATSFMLGFLGYHVLNFFTNIMMISRREDITESLRREIEEDRAAFIKRDEEVKEIARKERQALEESEAKKKHQALEERKKLAKIAKLKEEVNNPPVHFFQPASGGKYASMADMEKYDTEHAEKKKEVEKLGAPFRIVTRYGNGNPTKFFLESQGLVSSETKPIEGLNYTPEHTLDGGLAFVPSYGFTTGASKPDFIWAENTDISPLNNASSLPKFFLEECNRKSETNVETKIAVDIKSDAPFQTFID